MKTSSHILWHAINKYENQKYIIMKMFFKKGPGILFGQLLFFAHSLKLFLVGPPNCAYTLQKMRCYPSFNTKMV
jgi:hypothetical protein